MPAGSWLTVKVSPRTYDSDMEPEFRNEQSVWTRSRRSAAACSVVLTLTALG